MLIYMYNVQYTSSASIRAATLNAGEQHTEHVQEKLKADEWNAIRGASHRHK